ncbi:MAG: hypothetical protein K5829_14935 [Treponema sp.]|nr:hypothetical protein [Treponema sp.]
MTYSLEPAYLVQSELTRLIMKAGNSTENKWFFADGCFSADAEMERSPNTWQHENFAVIADREIIAYFEGVWSKPLNIISNFRTIVFNKNKGFIACQALFDYFDYLFNTRGCRAFNWFVAEKNNYAHRLYDKFISRYFGHIAGTRHCGQMAYNGEVSDIILYEITSEEYFAWKNMHFLPC